MNISPQDIKGTCHYKCDYSFEYPISSSTAVNNGDVIVLSYNYATSSVLYNNIKYDVLSCYLYSPSIHLYNNIETDGEFIITHSPSSGGNPLNICIPISTAGLTNSASQTLSEIITAISQGAPSQGGSVSQGISEYTLNEFIPLKEYYNYTTPTMDVIAFGIQQAIYISTTSLQSLQKSIIKNTSISFPSGYELFLSSGRPVKGFGSTGNEIYIDCQPTNESEEQISQTEIKSATTYDTGSITTIFTNPAFIMFMSSLVFVVIIIGIQKLISSLSGAADT